MENNYPSKAIRIIVPLPQGGPADILARIIAQKLSALWGQQVTVENHVGGDTITGTSLVAHAPPDGYTLLVVPSQFTVHPRQRTDLPYNVIDGFAPVILLALSTNVLVVHPSVAADSVEALIALARARPGALKYATGGPRSTSHVAAEKFKTLAGIDIAPIHYEGAAPATDALVAGKADILFSVMAPSLPHVQGGRLKALAVTGPKRSRALADVPTMKEAGLADFEITTWQGMLAPAGTAPEVVTKLNTEVRKILQLSDVEQQTAARGFDLAGSTPEEFAALISREVKG